MSKHIQIKLSEATLAHQAEHQARISRLPAGTPTPNIGQNWVNTDGETWTIIAAKTNTWYLHNHGNHVLVSFDDLVDHWSYTDCNHDQWCCTTHKTHTSPHKGCVLR